MQYNKKTVVISAIAIFLLWMLFSTPIVVFCYNAFWGTTIDKGFLEGYPLDSTLKWSITHYDSKQDAALNKVQLEGYLYWEDDPNPLNNQIDLILVSAEDKQYTLHTKSDKGWLWPRKDVAIGFTVGFSPLTLHQGAYEIQLSISDPDTGKTGRLRTSQALVFNSGDAHFLEQGEPVIFPKTVQMQKSLKNCKLIFTRREQNVALWGYTHVPEQSCDDQMVFLKITTEKDNAKYYKATSFAYPSAAESLGNAEKYQYCGYDLALPLDYFVEGQIYEIDLVTWNQGKWDSLEEPRRYRYEKDLLVAASNQ